MKKKRFRQWWSVHVAKNPRGMILLGIVILNILFFLVAAELIYHLTPYAMRQAGIWATIYYTITMVLDAGCISSMVEIGQTGVAVIIACIVTVLIGMILFTGGMIGYVTNVISGFIENANAGTRKLTVSDHTVILNWNNRASEIVNDLLYKGGKETVVVLVSEDRQGVQAEIENRLADTISRENRTVREEAARRGYGWLASELYCMRHQFRSNLTVIVRQGDTFSSKQLLDISLDQARTVIILNQDLQTRVCQLANEDRRRDREKGNPLTIKTLVLVAEITGAESSADQQKIIVEVEDNWTEDLVEKIINHKKSEGKNNIIPISVNRILGQLLSQFSIMPQLNAVYNELFSNKGAEFYAKEVGDEVVSDHSEYLKNHPYAVPLSEMATKSGTVGDRPGHHVYFMADKPGDVDRIGTVPPSDFTVSGNPDCWQPRRNVLILGHNSKVSALMAGFQSYRSEWNPAKDGRDILNITVVDDEKSLEKQGYYQNYPYVNKPVKADIYDRETIYEAINRFIDDEDGDTGILILSDDTVASEDLDASALTYLIYVQDVLAERRRKNGGKDTERIDVVIEILNPKNDDVVRSYNVNNVVISNRYISKMITQIGEKDALFEFYNDILTYDTEEDSASGKYTSMELYIKPVLQVFTEIPRPCTAAELIRAVYADCRRFGEENMTLVLGVLDAEDNMTLFAGEHSQNDIPVTLDAESKLIVFSNH